MGLLDSALEAVKSATPLGQISKGIDMVKGFVGTKSDNPLVRPLQGNPETKKKVESIIETSKEERGSIAGEVFESYLDRKMPWLSKAANLAGWFGLKDEDPEAWPGQQWFERLTALTMFVPDFGLKWVTEPIRSSGAFQKLVEYWPLMGGELTGETLESGPGFVEASEDSVWGKLGLAKRKKWAEIIKDPNCDPDDVINVIRIMQQDISLGFVSYKNISSVIGTDLSILEKLKAIA